MEKASTPAAKCGTVVVCLFIVLAGQVWLLWDTLAAGFHAWPAAVRGELVFCVIMLAAILWCWFRPKGWTSNLGCGIAFGLFGIYLIYTIIFYNSFAELYLSAINTEFSSVGKALVALKLVLVILAVIAGIPTAPAPTGREYADKLRQAYYRQEAELAKGNAKGAKQDFDNAMKKLRENLSQEEIDALLAQLRTDAAPDEAGPDEGGAEASDRSPSEDLHGWGGGA